MGPGFTKIKFQNAMLLYLTSKILIKSIRCHDAQQTTVVLDKSCKASSSHLHQAAQASGVCRLSLKISALPRLHQSHGELPPPRKPTAPKGKHWPRMEVSYASLSCSTVLVVMRRQVARASKHFFFSCAGLVRMGTCSPV